jgi:DNA repair photolyase
MTTFRKEFCKPHKEGQLFIVTYESAEERGGASKPCGLFVADKLSDLPIEDLCEEDIYEVRNGALFRINDCIEMEIEGNEGNAECLIDDKPFNPDHTAWWKLFSNSSNDEDEDDEDEEETKGNPEKGYIVIRTRWDYDANKFKRDVAITKRWSQAFGALTAAESQYDIYKLEKGEARLIASNASIHVKVIRDTTGFSQYDRAINPYKSCEHKCAYCYTGHYKDFKELPNTIEGRVVIGTHTDPYQPREQQERKTREYLKQLLNKKNVTKVGIFTKSPTVVEDIDLIKQLPAPHVHINLSPFPEEWRKKVEPGLNWSNEDRLKAIAPLKAAGIKVVLNFCPCIPDLTEQVLMTETIQEAFKQADEICIGLLVMYSNIDVESILPEESLKKILSRDWEQEFIEACREAIGDEMNRKLVIWRDRTRKGWKRLSDLTFLPQEFYAEHASVIQKTVDDWHNHQFEVKLTDELVTSLGERFGEYQYKGYYERGNTTLCFKYDNPDHDGNLHNYEREGNVVYCGTKYFKTIQEVEDFIGKGK